MMIGQQDIVLQKLEVADAAWLSALATKAYSDHYADTWYDEGAWYMQTYFNPSHLQQELADHNVHFFGIRYKTEPVGFVKINLHKPLDDEKNAMELERIYLTKNASGKGIGTYVVNFVIALALKENKKLIWLKVMDTNPDAVRFYAKMGFEICGTHKVDFMQKKEDMRGMYVMQKRLSAQ